MHLRFFTSALCFASAIASPAATVPAFNPQTATTPAASGSPAFNFSNFHLETALPWTSAGNGLTNDHWASNEFILGSYTLPYVSQRWVFTAGGEVQGTPTVEGNSVYVADKSGMVSQLDAATGKPTWQASLPTISGDPMAYSRNSPAIGANNVIVGDQDSATLYALSKTTGALV